MAPGRATFPRLTPCVVAGSYGRYFASRLTTIGGDFMRVSRLVLLGGLALLAGCGGSSQQAASNQKTGGSDSADHSQAVVSYYRKKANVPPSQKVTVVGLKDAAIGGVK